MSADPHGHRCTWPVVRNALIQRSFNKKVFRESRDSVDQALQWPEQKELEIGAQFSIASR